MTRLIGENITSDFRRLIVGTHERGILSSGRTPNTPRKAERASLPDHNDNGINDVPRNYTNFYNNNDIFPPGHIINNWKVKFIGDSRGMSVNNFLYRIDALTRQTLNEKFVLTTYFHSLR